MTNIGNLFRATVGVGALVGSLAWSLTGVQEVYAAREEDTPMALTALRWGDDGDDLDAAPPLTGSGKGNGNKPNSKDNVDSSGCVDSSGDNASKSSGGKSSGGKSTGSGGSGSSQSSGADQSGNTNCGPGENQQIPFVPLAAAYPAVGAVTFAAAYGIRRRRNASR